MRLQLKLDFPRKAKGAFLVFLNQFNQDEGQKAWLSLEERKFFLQLNLMASDLDPVLIRQKVSRYLWLTAGLLAGGNLIPPVQEIALHAQLCPTCLAVLEKATLHQQHQRMVEEAEDEIFKADKPKCGPPDADFWELPPF
ncbi:MAG: hypothetical protein IV090_17170 [Candidatus Sericytochromatia bacterium]|nr:hypothetical protein [Candidatus Sericytochromatia bacterium]